MSSPVQIPVPRSYNQILGDEIDSFLARCGLSQLKVGSPVLSMLEASAQSDFRNSQDLFNILKSSSLVNATGNALDRLGADEELTRITETSASGGINIIDSSFTKISTNIFQGKPAPIAGSYTIYVVSASAFTATGNLYIGRNTLNYEGPLPYTSATNSGTYWTIVLSSSTQNYHNLGETVILAQGGNRAITSGTQCQTPQGATSNSIQFNVLFSATIPDGETEIDGVTVSAVVPGLTGNVAAGSISSFSSPPFNGATVTNPLPFTNALATETDDDFRERIRATRASRTQGTSLAIITGIVGITSSSENKTVTSASIVNNLGETAILYIDDGTGYEETSIGIAIESVEALAFGGEQFFSVASAPPVTKASITTTLSAPFNLPAGAVLAVNVGGVLNEHTFNSSDFQNISNAAVFEVVSSINADYSLAFAARPSNAGTTVTLFAKSDTDEDLQVIPASTNGIADVDANASLGFPAGIVYTMRLYKNDLLLSKDGQAPILQSRPISNWGAITGTSPTLIVAVDGTPATTYTITAQNFINANTGFSTIGVNSLAAWAAVFNAVIPGITASVTGSTIVIASNLGAQTRASVVISGGTLMGEIFDAGTSLGKNNDYDLNRNTGQIRLSSPLNAGDTLSAGSVNTRAFIQSPAFVTTNITLSGGGNLWFVVDGAAQVIPTGVTNGTTLNITVSFTESWGKRVRITSATAATLFTNVNVGDTMIVWDSALVSANRGVFHIAQVDSGFTWVEVERQSGFSSTQAGVALANGGIVFVRTTGTVQKVNIPVLNNYTAQALAVIFNASLVGATATVYQNDSFRINTNTYAANGDIALVAIDVGAIPLGLTAGSAIKNLSSHISSVQSANGTLSTPTFQILTVSTVVSTSAIDVNTNPATGGIQICSGDTLVGLKNLPDSNIAGLQTRAGENVGFTSTITSQSIAAGVSTMVLRNAVPVEWIVSDRIYEAQHLSIAPNDSLTVVLDQNTLSKRFIVPLERHAVPAGASSYGSTLTLLDADNGNASFGSAFGFTSGYNFADFAVFMNARAVSDPSSIGTSVTANSILYRWNRQGADGNLATIRYTYPPLAGQPLSIVTQARGQNPGIAGPLVNIQLASGTARSITTTNVRTLTNVGLALGLSGGVYTYMYLLGLPITSAQNTTGALGGTTTVTVTLPTLTPAITNHGLVVGDLVYIKMTAGGYTSGLVQVTATPAGNTFSYIPAGVDPVGPTSVTGTMSFDTQGETNFNISGITVGDVFTVSSLALFTSQGFVQQTFGIKTLGYQFVSGLTDNNVGLNGATATVSATILWQTIGNTAAFSDYPLATNTTASIVSYVNAQALVAGTTSPLLNAYLLGSGGTITKSSLDENLTAYFSYPFTDGLNFVQSNTTPSSGNYVFTLKDPTSALLAGTSANWAGDVVTLVPITIPNLASWLNNQAVTGLFQNGSILASSQDHFLQISTDTAGSVGSIQVQGGTGNALSIALQDSSQAIAFNGSMVSAVNLSDAVGLTANTTVALQNTNAMPRAVITSATVLDSISIDALGNTATVVISGTNAWTENTAGHEVLGVQVAVQGNFACYTWNGQDGAPGGVFGSSDTSEGDYIYVIATGTPDLPTLSSANTGTFRVVRVDNNNYAIWVENPSAVVEGPVWCEIMSFKNDGMMAGDILNISTPVWGGAGNMGAWTIVEVGTNAVGGNQYQAGVQGTFRIAIPTGVTLTAVSSVQPALGTNASLVQVYEGTPSRLIKYVSAISTSATSGSLVDVQFSTSNGYSKVGIAAGTLLQSLDKLAFPTTLANGIDGYAASTGLIAEAVAVAYGDAQDEATYPGIIAAGASIDVSGPIIKRIQCALGIRVSTSTANYTDIEDQIQSAVASVINAAGVGVSIAIDDIIDAARSVAGVTSVVVISPIYGVGNDLITVQPFEKPMVLNLQTDITVSFVGQ